MIESNDLVAQFGSAGGEAATHASALVEKRECCLAVLQLFGDAQTC